MEDSSAIWTEKYRPSTFDEVKGQKEIVKRIRAFVKQKNMPHVLFAGPPGVGKTTLSLVTVKELFGKAWRDNFLELNASDERGIDVVRIKVKDFARTKALGNVPFKIIYLDECDALTKEAQQALRRTMERFTETCRFIMIANYSGKIIEPLQSRCAPFRFSYMSQQDQNRYLRNIIEKENIKILDEGYDAIFEVSQGDLRRATNTIQAAASMGKEIDAQTVYSVIGHANPEDVDTMLKTAMKGDFLAARKLLREMIMKYGVAGSDIIKQIHSAIFRSQLPDTWKVTLSEAVGEADFRMVQGADVEVQLSALLARMTEAGQELQRGC